MKKTNVINKEKVIICIGVILIILFLIISIVNIPKEQIGINAIVTENDVKLYSSPVENNKKIKQDIIKNSEVKIIDTVVEDNKVWYSVSLNGKNGYILAENVEYYGKNKIKQYLVSDFSSFDFKNTFNNKCDLEAFLVNNNISNVYIRAGRKRLWKRRKILY